MAEQALVQVRLDKDLRDEVADIYAKMGLDIPTAIRMFLPYKNRKWTSFCSYPSKR